MATTRIMVGDGTSVTQWSCPAASDDDKGFSASHHLVTNPRTGVTTCVYCKQSSLALRVEQASILRLAAQPKEITVPSRTTSIVITTSDLTDVEHSVRVKEVIDKMAANGAYFGVVPEEGTGYLHQNGGRVGTFTIVTSTTE